MSDEDESSGEFLAILGHVIVMLAIAAGAFGLELVLDKFGPEGPPILLKIIIYTGEIGLALVFANSLIRILRILVRSLQGLGQDFSERNAWNGFMLRSQNGWLARTWRGAIYLAIFGAILLMVGAILLVFLGGAEPILAELISVFGAAAGLLAKYVNFRKGRRQVSDATRKGVTEP
jgi:hypothetical protein